MGLGWACLEEQKDHRREDSCAAGRHGLGKEEACGWEELALRTSVMERSNPDGKHVQVIMGFMMGSSSGRNGWSK